MRKSRLTIRLLIEWSLVRVQLREPIFLNIVSDLERHARPAFCQSFCHLWRSDVDRYLQQHTRLRADADQDYTVFWMALALRTGVRAEGASGFVYFAEAGGLVKIGSTLCTLHSGLPA